MGKYLIYNKGKFLNSEHIDKNIRMFEKMDIECHSFWNIPSIRQLVKADILYLNWYENLYKGTTIIAFVQYVFKILVLSIVKALGIKIYTSQHNRTVHDAHNPKLCNSLFKKILKYSDRIIVFSKIGVKDLTIYISNEEAKVKSYYIPPVNYIGSYEYEKHEWISRLASDDKLTILFCGTLKHPYKNVDMVIDIANTMREEKIHFIFAGNPGTKENEERFLREKDNNNNISFVFKYIADNEMAHLLEISDILIMPYNTESIANSGTARLAFSYAKTVICPMIPSLTSIPLDLVYTYIDSENRKDTVSFMIKQCYKDWIIDKNTFKHKGEKLKKIMEENNSPEVVSRRYYDLFFESIVR